MTYKVGQTVNTTFNDKHGAPVAAEIVKIRPNYCAPYQVRFKSGFEWCFDKKELDTAAERRIPKEVQTMSAYYITNKHDQPINVWHDGSGPHIQISKKCCETYRSHEEAQERLDYLRERVGRRLTHLTISTFARF